MRYLISLVLCVWGGWVIAQDWEDAQTFGDTSAGTQLNIISSTDTSFFAPIIADFLTQNDGVQINYFVQGTADIDQIFRADPQKFDIIISSAMDLQLKLVNDGFGQAIPQIDHPDWAQWRKTLFAFTAEPAAIVINKAAFAGLILPKTRQDLIRSLREHPDRFRGKLGTYDVRRSGLGYLFATQDARTSETYWRLTEVMGSLQAKLYCCSGEMIDDLISGKIVVAYNVLGSYASAREMDEDAIRVILPSDFPTTMMRTAMISNQSAKAQASTLFLSHLIAHQDRATGPDSLPPISPTTPQAIISLEPALMTYLDRLKRQTFLAAWESAIIQ